MQPVYVLKLFKVTGLSKQLVEETRANRGLAASLPLTQVVYIRLVSQQHWYCMLKINNVRMIVLLDNRGKKSRLKPSARRMMRLKLGTIENSREDNKKKRNNSLSHRRSIQFRRRLARRGEQQQQLALPPGQAEQQLAISGRSRSLSASYS